jgi:ADP-ribose pyrophosphatase YjhB (NUDIX family)
LLAKRKGEADFDGVFSFIGGKMETTDETLLAGMQREKNEEVGDEVRLRIFLSKKKVLLATSEQKPIPNQRRQL